MEAFVIYMTFNNIIAKILELYGTNFGVDYAADPGGTSGLKLIGSVKTLDTSIIGAIMIATVIDIAIGLYYFTLKDDMIKESLEEEW